MATRKGINISGHYAISINDICLFIYVLCIKKKKDRTESYFILLLKLNDNPIRYFNFGLRRIHLNGCQFIFLFFFNQI